MLRFSFGVRPEIRTGYSPESGKRTGSKIRKRYFSRESGSFTFAYSAGSISMTIWSGEAELALIKAR